MTKQKYITLLTRGPLEKEISDALLSCGYSLKRSSDFSGCITHDYVKAIDTPESYSNFGNVFNINNKTESKG